MFAFWLTCGYFNSASNNSQQKNDKKELFLVILPAPHEIGPCCNLVRGASPKGLSPKIAKILTALPHCLEGRLL